MQYVSFVDKDGSAFEGGVRLHDRLLEVNEQDVAGASHKLVVQHVRGGTTPLHLLCICAPRRCRAPVSLGLAASTVSRALGTTNLYADMPLWCVYVWCTLFVQVLNGGDHLKLKVIRVDATEAARLQRIEEAGETGKAPKPLALVKPKYLIKSFEGQ